MIWLDYAFPKTDEEEAQMVEIQLPVLLNLAVCHLKMKEYSEVLSHCYQALKLDADNTKALYCQAKAHRFLDNFEDATASIQRARELDPQNVELRCEQALLENKKKRYRLETKRRAQAMFGAAPAEDKEQPLAPIPAPGYRSSAAFDLLHPSTREHDFEDDEELRLATAHGSDED